MKILFSSLADGSCCFLSSWQASNIIWHLLTRLNAICVLISSLQQPRPQESWGVRWFSLSLLLSFLTCSLPLSLVDALSERSMGLCTLANKEKDTYTITYTHTHTHTHTHSTWWFGTVPFCTVRGPSFLIGSQIDRQRHPPVYLLPPSCLVMQVNMWRKRLPKPDKMNTVPTNEAADTIHFLSFF